MKILIVGAGPIGCYVARLLKKRSFDFQIIEEHSEIGKPVHCAGLIGKNVLTEINFSLNEDVILNHIDGAQFFLNGDSFKIYRKDVALVIDRKKFDCALGYGLNIDFNTRFVGIEKESRGYLVETDRGEYYADIVIGADGANSLVRKNVGFKEDIEYLRGVQFRMKHDKYNKNLVQVYLKKPFFAWVIPESNTIIRVGIISDNPYHNLSNFLIENSIEGEIIEKFAGVALMGKCSTQMGNLFLVGDAACQVKPLTHGGIYYGMRCAEILVDCITNNRASDYEKLWREKFEKEVWIGLRAKHVYQQLSHGTLEKIFCLLKDNADLLERFGDFENHSKIISTVIKNPHLQSLLGKVLIDIIKDTPL